MVINKKALSEEDIKMKYITPAIEKAGWDIKTQVRAEYSFTDGRIIVRGNLVARGKRKRADYILSYKPNMPLAIIEAKDNNKPMGAGMQQALEYGDILDIPFIYSSNGDGFIEHDNFTGKERELSLEEFPSPDELWERYKAGKGIQAHEEKIVSEDYFFDMSGKSPRYYQRVAINRTIEAISKGQDRILLVMATGTGKTYTAFQIIYRLWKSKTKKRILFLADRNILVDQTMTNDFKHFGDKMIKVNRQNIDKAHEIYLALYQSMTGSEDWQNVYKEFSPDFFDLVIVDECHRGSAKDNSAWREVLEYFNSATQIGLTATPKETKDISTSNYFGEPVYTYSLKQGIEDGFLAPYKVVRVSLDKDLEGYRPTKGKLDKYGNLIEDRIYNISDFDKNLILEKRTEIVAKKVTEFLNKTNRFDKTIVFCVDIDHAERMRQALVNENSDLVKESNKYIMRITGDNDEGKAQLDNFIDPASKYPTIVTTSKLMTTGVDAQTCKLIVLDSNINSMTEFKQIIGRGTRIKEEYGKQYFTIMDFRGVTRLFADPDFDGDPVVIYEPEEGETIVPPDTEGGIAGYPSGNSGEGEFEEGDEKSGRVKYVVDDVGVMVVNERVEYYDKDGKLVTESLKDYTRKNIRKEYADLNQFINRWNSEEKKTAILKELEEKGVFFDAIKEEVGKDLDDFDLILHLAFDQKPLTRKERADNVKKRNYFGKYSDIAREVLEALLDKYMNEGISELESIEILKLDPFTEIGTPTKIIKSFGGRDKYIQTVKELEEQIYA
ncbi:EcoAI/FtnUII family type I restriction enzme subunit R [Tissierella praeacuta]|uniref:EcoAI/FtnUII family type I restriction enzme subunit R n=1 Tax=Tissierella praeacuta TaxID=43131 RepID=UPI002FD9CD45